MNVQVDMPIKTKALRTMIPFCGFYESIWDSAFEDELSEIASSLLDELKQDDKRYADESFGDILEAVYDSLRTDDACKAIAEEYADRFGDFLLGELGLKDAPCIFRFESLYSPKEYNFKTDQIFVEVSPDVCRALWAQTDQEVLRKMVFEHHHPRSGFASFYSEHLCLWDCEHHNGQPHPVTRWDHNELYTLLCAWMATAGQDPEMIEGEILNTIVCNGGMENIVHAALDLEAAKQKLLLPPLIA